MKRLFSFGREIMERFRNSKRKKVAPVDYFDKLPDELVVEIFKKVSEAKWLCMCYMVSRRFASLVLQSPTVSIKWSFKVNETFRLNFMSMMDKFLAKFVSIQSLHLEFINEFTNVDGPLPWDIIKWKAVGYQKRSSFVMLLVRGRSVITTADNDDKPKVIDPRLDQQVVAYYYQQVVAHYYEIAYIAQLYYQSRYFMLSKLLHYLRFPNLKEAVVTDCSNLGKLFIREKADIDLLRSTDPMTIPPIFSQLWSQPVLKVPSAGFLAGKSDLIIYKSSNDIDDVSIVKDAFREEKELCEAAMELLKRKPVLYSRLCWSKALH